MFEKLNPVFKSLVASIESTEATMGVFEKLNPVFKSLVASIKSTEATEKLNPVFKSLVASIESTEATMGDHIEKAFQNMLKIEEKFMACFSQKVRNPFLAHSFVSSNLANNP
jgi:ATP-dependent helicase/DNAse subunit B